MTILSWLSLCAESMKWAVFATLYCAVQWDLNYFGGRCVTTSEFASVKLERPLCAAFASI
jgi:hypothetical protein